LLESALPVDCSGHSRLGDDLVKGSILPLLLPRTTEQGAQFDEDENEEEGEAVREISRISRVVSHLLHRGNFSSSDFVLEPHDCYIVSIFDSEQSEKCNDFYFNFF